MSSATLNHLKSLLKDDGHQFTMVRKADLTAALQLVAIWDEADWLKQLGELNRTMAEQSQVIDEAFSTITNNARNARKHGDERRRYMANNRALLAHTEQQAATITEMGELIDSQAARLAELEEERDAYRDLYRRNLGALMGAQSRIDIIRRAARA